MSFGPLELGAVFVLIGVAACIQASIGFGMALVAAPVLVLIEPAFVPGPLMASALLLVALIAWRDHQHADFSTVRFAVVGYVLGAIAGASVLTRLEPRSWALLVGSLVLLAVAISAFGSRLRVSRRLAAGAGAMGGFMGTTSAVGGPPVALVYQNEPPERLRGTLSTYFIATSFIGLTVLFFFGRFGTREVELALYLLPGQVAGFLLSYVATPWLDGRSTRPAVLGLATVAALVVLARAV